MKMPRTCSVCGHDQRDVIERALVSGMSYRDIAGQFALSRNAVHRHATSHLPATVPEAQAASEVERATALSDRLEELYKRAERILTETEATGRHNVSLASIRELRGILEFAAKLAGMPAAEPVRIQLFFADGSPVEDDPPLRVLPDWGLTS
jgi:hypothetical protein